MKTQTGFLGFFDILGYQSLLVNNDPKDIADNVLSELTALESSIKVALKKQFPEFDALHKIYEESLKWLIFSDTILISLDVPSELEEGDLYEHILTFLLASAILQQNLLLNGLPLRGCLTFGDYIIKDACFAGKPIIEAYRLSEKLELSACVIAKSASEKFKSIVKDRQAEFLLVEYLIPLKKSDPKKMLTLNYGAMEDHENPRDIVFKAFFAHNKDIPESVQQKMLNTEQHLRFLDICHKQRKEKSQPVK